MIERLDGPRTHICWTPDGEKWRVAEPPLVSLVREDDLAALESEVQFLLDGLAVPTFVELKRLVDLGREHDSTALHGEALLGVPLS